MSVYKVLADIVDALRTSHLEHQTMATKQDLAEGLAAVRAEMAAGFAGLTEQIRKLGLEFEEFRHNSKIALEMISSLMTTVNRHDSDIARLGRRVTRVERHLDLPPLPNGK